MKNADGTDSYDAEANQNFAKNLKGHLLLAHGTMDTNVPPYQTMLDRRRADQGEQGLRPADDSERESRLRRGVELHDAAPLGLLREVAHGRRAAEGISDEVNRRRSSGLRLRRAFDVEIRDRRDVRRFERRFDRRAIADDHDGQVIEVDVLLRHAQHVLLRHRGDRFRYCW